MSAVERIVIHMRRRLMSRGENYKKRSFINALLSQHNEVYGYKIAGDQVGGACGMHEGEETEA